MGANFPGAQGGMYLPSQAPNTPRLKPIEEEIAIFWRGHRLKCRTKFSEKSGKYSADLFNATVTLRIGDHVFNEGANHHPQSETYGQESAIRNYSYEEQKQVCIQKAIVSLEEEVRKHASFKRINVQEYQVKIALGKVRQAREQLEEYKNQQKIAHDLGVAPHPKNCMWYSGWAGCNCGLTKPKRKLVYDKERGTRYLADYDEDKKSPN